MTVVTIIDYGAGNLKSVQNMLRYLGYKSSIAKTTKEVEQAEKLLLPGVGAFNYGMEKLVERGLVDVLNYKVQEQQTPILGICLGAQLLTRGSDEGTVSGLGWVEADTRRFNAEKMDDSLRIPHMGWTDTQFRARSRLFTGVKPTPRYYYVHSYHMVCDSPENELCYANYGYQFASGIEKGNIVGVQFHPEKSHKFGMKILKNFVELY